MKKTTSLNVNKKLPTVMCYKNASFIVMINSIWYKMSEWQYNDCYDCLYTSYNQP